MTSNRCLVVTKVAHGNLIVRIVPSVGQLEGSMGSGWVCNSFDEVDLVIREQMADFRECHFYYEGRSNTLEFEKVEELLASMKVDYSSVDEIDELIESIILPLALPNEVFALSGTERLPSLDSLIGHLPEKLRARLDLDMSGISKLENKEAVYRFWLIDGSYITLKVKNEAIVELARILRKKVIAIPYERGQMRV